MTRYWCERAWLGPGRLESGVLVTVDDSRFADVAVSVAEAPPDADQLSGLTFPGFANCHSHAFHRALRARTQGGRGTFWTWRDQMYAVAERLDPDSYYALARATYAEMALAGITCVGEFHYLHHGPGGTPYEDRNAMGSAVIEAARDVGLRVCLLDACYVAGGIGQPVEATQQRFSDGDAGWWTVRVEALHGAYADVDGVIVGGAVHSVRAVPRDQFTVVAQWAEAHTAPLHAHVSEQPAENTACVEAYGRTPVQLLQEHGVLGPRSTAVHATHLSDGDIAVLGQSTTAVCLCPTTERDLADGVGPGRRLHDAGARITVGSDSHAVIDVFEELRAVEMHERLVSQERGHWSAEELLAAATGAGHAALGFHDAGRIAPGAWADLVTVDIDTPRMAGAGATTEAAVFAATAADVTHVVASGKVVVPGLHTPADVSAHLVLAVDALW